MTGRYLDTLHKYAVPTTRKNAKNLRQTATEAEQKLWSLLRNRQLKGKKFRRQHVYGDYILDFYCNESKLAVELDGSIHLQRIGKEYDKLRTHFLNNNGIAVLRFWNKEIINRPEKVLARIAKHLGDCASNFESDMRNPNY